MKNNYKTYLIILILSFIFYGNTIKNKYALDDIVVITENRYVQKGIKGILEIITNDLFTGYYGKKQNLVSGGRYRPISLITFALEKEFFGNNPHISHFINVLFFSLLCIFLFKMLYLLFSLNDSKLFISIPFLATIFFVSHPIHTEVVANIKGREDILAFLFGILSIYFAISFFKFEKNKYLYFTSIFFILSCLSKEIAVTLIILIPLTIWFFVNKEILSDKYYKMSLSLVIPFVLYTIIRALALSKPEEHEPYLSLINNSFLEMNVYQKIATIFYTFLLYLKLLFIPYPLTIDYYPYHIPKIEIFSLKFLISFLVAVFVVFITLKTFFKKNYLISYSIIFYLITLLPMLNIIAPIGTFMNERFLFFPSFGFCLLLAYFFNKLYYGRKKIIALILLGILISSYWIICFKRNNEWYDNFTLFSSDIKKSENSCWGNLVFGTVLLDSAIAAKDSVTKFYLLKQSFKHLYKALEIYPDYLEAYLHLGAAYYQYNKNYDSMIWAYKNVLRLDRNYDLAYKNFEIIFKDFKDYDKIIETYEDLIKINPYRFEINYMLGYMYGKNKGNIKKSLYYLNRAYKIKSFDKQVLKDLGVAYGIAEKPDSSIYFLNKAIELDPNDANSHLNIAISYFKIGNLNLALYHYDMAVKINPLFKNQFFEDLKKNVKK